MKTATVGQPGSQFHGLRAKCCRRTTKAGQVISWTLTAGAPRASWRERAFALHLTCMGEMVASAPEGAPARPSDVANEIAALRAAGAA